VETWRHAVDTNVTGTLYLLQKVLRDMVARDDGKILVTGSIAGYIPGAFNAVYNGTKAMIDNVTEALRNEIKDVKGVTLTTLMPGATDTEFFARAGMLDTDVGQDPHKADPAKVARDEGRRSWRARATSSRVGRTSCRSRPRASCRSPCWPNSIAKWQSQAQRIERLRAGRALTARREGGSYPIALQRADPAHRITVGAARWPRDRCGSSSLRPRPLPSHG
jgi:NAD(P)-dependent dehydrogenase (short-subunit alcohol dehydrogenase family)